MFCIVSSCQHSKNFSECDVPLFSRHFLCISGLPAEPVMPEFTEEVTNKTVVAGREAVLACHVTHIGSYKVERGFYSPWLSFITKTFLNHQGCLGQS